MDLSPLFRIFLLRTGVGAFILERGFVCAAEGLKMGGGGGGGSGSGPSLKKEGFWNYVFEKGGLL